jgi:hypothetical protein
MTGGESSSRDKDVAAIRKILAGCAKRATGTAAALCATSVRTCT